jgi:hypothetical protein
MIGNIQICMSWQGFFWCENLHKYMKNKYGKGILIAYFIFIKKKTSLDF